MKNARKQKGFTIIELVVVILLLGILTATALPRFMDVTDEAHQAVVDGLEGGLATGLALFRAQWYAENQPTTAVSEFSLFASPTSGYPVGAANADVTDAAALDGTDCLAVYNNLLQAGGRPVAAAADWSGTAATLETNIEAAAANADVVATANDDTTVTACIYHYTGQYKSGGSGTGGNPPSRTIQTLTYTFATGAITEGTLTLNNN